MGTNNKGIIHRDRKECSGLQREGTPPGRERSGQCGEHGNEEAQVAQDLDRMFCSDAQRPAGAHALLDRQVEVAAMIQSLPLTLVKRQTIGTLTATAKSQR